MTEPQAETEVQKLTSRSRMRGFVILTITIAGALLCFLLALPILPALIWAIALAILFLPAHRRLEARLKQPSLAALVSVLWIALLVVVPIALLGGRLITEAAKGASKINERVTSGEWRRTLEAHETISALVQWIDEIDLPGAVANGATWAASTSAVLVQGWILQLITAVLSFYLLFYFLRDRNAALEWLRQVSPLSEEEMNSLLIRIVETVQGTLYGTVVVAAVQGSLGGLIFWWLDLPAPLFWGLVMGLLAVVPVLGAFVVWVPVAIFFALDGEWVKAMILALWGALVIGGIDNVLHPMLVGNRLRLHTVPSFIAIVGGLILFGPAGLLLGPLAVTITVFFLEIWRVRIGAETKAGPLRP